MSASATKHRTDSSKLEAGLEGVSEGNGGTAANDVTNAPPIKSRHEVCLITAILSPLQAIFSETTPQKSGFMREAFSFETIPKSRWDQSLTCSSSRACLTVSRPQGKAAVHLASSSMDAETSNPGSAKKWRLPTNAEMLSQGVHPRGPHPRDGIRDLDSSCERRSGVVLITARANLV